MYSTGRSSVHCTSATVEEVFHWRTQPNRLFLRDSQGRGGAFEQPLERWRHQYPTAYPIPSHPNHYDWSINTHTGCIYLFISWEKKTEISVSSKHSDWSIHNHTDCIYLLFYILNVSSKHQVWSIQNNNGHIFYCILNVSSDSLSSLRTAAPFLSTFTHQLLRHPIHPFLLIPAQLPIQLLGHPLVYLLRIM